MTLELGQTAEVRRTFPPSDADTFARLAGLDGVPKAVPEPLIGGLFSYLLGVKLPGFGTNYLKQEMRFLAAAAFGEELTARVTVTRLRPEKHLVDLETVCVGGDGRRVCEGRALVYVEDVGA
ncbi:phosphate acetyltransferase [Stappia sp.]|uniref:phosphate acetyltransferase n=1 Tax=Stappia sp. TaxID=1870903 RepID=UPI003A99318D